MDDEYDEEKIRDYVTREAREEVVHVEHAASERVGPVRHDIWDSHCTDSRWWVVTEPTNLYSQEDFKSRDVVLTFHIGLTMRLEYMREREVPLEPSAAALLPGTWRRWRQAVDTYMSGDEAETFQATGVRLRECLVSFIGEATDEETVPEGTDAPKGADFKGWTELLANQLAAGAASAKLRATLKHNSVDTWEYVNWLTHAKNAVRYDAEIGLKLVEYLLSLFTAARLRLGQMPARCPSCGSYEIVGGRCRHCGTVHPEYVEPEMLDISPEEPASRLAEPCTPSSDISTFMRPDRPR